MKFIEHLAGLVMEAPAAAKELHVSYAYWAGVLRERHQLALEGVGTALVMTASPITHFMGLKIVKHDGVAQPEVR